MRSVILCGVKGCGKTTFGQQLAAQWDWPFLDTDALLEVDPRELWVREGEEGFRAIERELVKSIRLTDPTVVSTGGGTLMDHENIEHLAKQGKIVHLVTNPEVCWERVRKHGIPPFLHGSDPFRTFLKLYDERVKHYQTIADETWELPLVE